VLDQLTPRVYAFLLQTSILDRLAAPLCDAVTDQKESQSLLEQLESANLFLIPLDGERRWYRYHHLFAELLRQRLRQTQRIGRRPDGSRNSEHRSLSRRRCIL
jgi:LuxR family maltose regulon positive regulatory protein